MAAGSDSGLSGVSGILVKRKEKAMKHSKNEEKCFASCDMDQEKPIESTCSQDALTNFLRSEKGVCIIAAVLFGLFAHGFMMTNEITNHDDMGEVFRRRFDVTQGRWMRGLWNYLIRTNSPWFNGILLIVVLAVAAVLITDMFVIKSRRLAACLGASFVTFPVIVSTFFYKFMIPTYATGILLAVAAAWLMIRRTAHGWGGTFQLAVLATVLSMSCYQAYFPLTAALLLIDLIRRTSLSATSDTSLVKRSISYLLFLAEGMIAYIVTIRILLLVTGQKLMDYNGMSGMGTLDVTRLPELITKAYSSFFTFYHSIFPENIYANIMDIMHGVLFCASIGYYMWRCKKRSSTLRICMTGVFALLFPLACNLCWLYGSNFVHSVMLLGNFALPTLFICFAKDIVNSCDGAQFRIKRFAFNVISAFFALCILANVYRANAVYLEQDRSHKEAALYLNRMVTQIQSIPDYDPSLPVCFVGNPSDPALKVVSDFVQKDGKRLTGTDSQQQFVSFALVSESKLGRFLKRYVGFGQEIIGGEQRSALAENPAIAAMPVYPSHGSIAVVNGVIVVHVG